MLLCEFRPSGVPGGSRLGIVEGELVYTTNEYKSMSEFLFSGRGPDSLRKQGNGLSVGSVSLSAPIPRPGKIVAAIVNTQAMLGGNDLSLDRPRLDMKAPSTVIGPGEPIQVPTSGIRPEVELAAVVGRRISRASPAEALTCIMGFTILNDVTAPNDSKDDAYEAYRRDRASGEIRKSLMRGPLFRSKNHDTFCPMGPWIATADELRDKYNLKMTTKLDGDLLQSGSTSEYIFSPEQIASYVSSFLALEPGDIISCGSVGWTPEALEDRDPTEFTLKRTSGVLELHIDRIGNLVNPLGGSAGTK